MSFFVYFSLLTSNVLILIAWLPFLGFIILSTFIFSNLVIAIMCEALMEMKHDESRKSEKELELVIADLQMQLRTMKNELTLLQRDLQFGLCNLSKENDDNNDKVDSSPILKHIQEKVLEEVGEKELKNHNGHQHHKSVISSPQTKHPNIQSYEDIALVHNDRFGVAINNMINLHDDPECPHPPHKFGLTSGTNDTIRTYDLHSTLDKQKSRSSGDYHGDINDHNNKLLHYFNEFGAKDLIRPQGIWSEARFKVGKIAHHPVFEIIISLFIIINTVLLGLETSSIMKTNNELKHTLHIVDTFFLIAYTIESAMKLFYHGGAIFKKKYVTFEIFIVTLSWIFQNSSVEVIRSLRIIRVLMIIPHFQPLLSIMEALGRIVPQLWSIFTVLILFYYIFAVMFTSLFKHATLSNDYFTRLDTTMLTLVQIMTMVNWAAISRELAVEYVWAPLLVNLFLCISGYVFLNLIVGLIVESLDRSNDEKHNMHAEIDNMGNVLKESQEVMNSIRKDMTVFTNSSTV